MKATEGEIGRVFVLRLEDGDIIPDSIERFAQEKGIGVASVVLNGGMGGGQLVVGPMDGEERPVRPMQYPVEGVHEVAAVGVIVPGPDGRPSLHLHGALGRSGSTLCGCFRPGVQTWVVGEVILQEYVGVQAERVMNEEMGFPLLQIGAEEEEVIEKGPPPTPPVHPEPVEEEEEAEVVGAGPRVLFLQNAEVR
jgi:predicted DNA-binding protein with PD1-like motif